MGCGGEWGREVAYVSTLATISRLERGLYEDIVRGGIVLGMGFNRDDGCLSGELCKEGGGRW